MLKFMLILLLPFAFQTNAFAASQTPFNKSATVKKATRSQAAVKSKYSICSIHAGDIGKLKYRATSYEAALRKVTDACFQKRTNLFLQRSKKQPDQDRQIQWVESCVNNIQCV